MSKIGIFYGPAGGNTEKVARLIAEKLGHENCDIYSTKEVGMQEIAKYPKIIFGIGSVDSETWQDVEDKSQWGHILREITKYNLSGYKVAIFGLGDQIRWATKFVDSMGVLYDILLKAKAEVVGFVPVDGYEFTDSLAVRNGKFVGLPLDEDNQPEQTNQRIEHWLKILQKELL